MVTMLTRSVVYDVRQCEERWSRRKLLSIVKPNRMFPLFWNICLVIKHNFLLQIQKKMNTDIWDMSSSNFAGVWKNKRPNLEKDNMCMLLGYMYVHEAWVILCDLSCVCDLQWVTGVMFVACMWLVCDFRLYACYWWKVYVMCYVLLEVYGCH